MPKPKLILWGNCQADYLADVLRASPGLAAAFEISDYLNFSAPGVFDVAQLPDEELSRCRVLIYHKVYNPANAAEADKKLALLPKGCLRIPIPYLKSNLYWLFFNSVIEPMAVSPEYPVGLLPCRSPILDSWLAKGYSDAAIIEAFTALDPAEHLNLELMEKETVRRWRELEREAEGKLKFAAYLEEHWRESMQFYIYNHIAKPVLLHLANQILSLLGQAPLGMKDIAPCYSGQDITYPVHPGLARAYSISFAKPGTRYGLGTRHYTFEEFIALYLELARAEAARQ